MTIPAPNAMDYDSENKIFKIYLKRDKSVYTIVDEIDISKVAALPWHLTGDGYAGTNAPGIINPNRRVRRMHTFILGFYVDLDIGDLLL